MNVSMAWECSKDIMLTKASFKTVLQDDSKFVKICLCVYAGREKKRPDG